MNTHEHRQIIVHQCLDEQIRKQAYCLWQQKGCPEGRELENWHEAREILVHRQGEATKVRLRAREHLSQLKVAQRPLAEVM